MSLKNTLFILGMLAFSSFFLRCGQTKATVETPEEFVDRIFSHLEAQDEKALFTDCYVSSEEEIRTMLNGVNQKNVSDERISEMHGAAMEDKNRVLRKFSRLGEISENSLVVDSINVENFDGSKAGFELEEGYRIAELTVYVSNKGNQFSIVMPCMDLKTGKWKLVNHPRVSLEE